MSRTTATLLLVTMIVLLVVGVIGFVLIGQQPIERSSITTAAPRVSPVYEQRPAAEQLRNGTWIPSACFSVILRQVDGRWDCMAFVMPNSKAVAGPVSRYLTMVSTMVSTINKAISLDVLAGMDEAEKRKVEQQRATELWR